MNSLSWIHSASLLSMHVAEIVDPQDFGMVIDKVSILSHEWMEEARFKILEINLIFLATQQEQVTEMPSSHTTG